MHTKIASPKKIHQALALLAIKQETPLSAYIYDLDALAQHAKSMVAALPSNCQLFYAAKANPEARVLATLAPIVHGFEAASGGELTWLREQLPKQPLIFGGPGKLDRELAQAITYEVELLHVESLYELKRLQVIAADMNAQVDILLRMNIPLGDIKKTKLAMGGTPTPFGLDESQLEQALAILEQCPNLTLKGFHFHLMSHQLCRDNHLKLMALYFDTFQRWQKQYCLSITHLNVGGGIGINYTDLNDVFNWPLFCEELTQLIAKKSMGSTNIRFECGRFISAACGYYCMEVLDIKESYGENFIVAKGGTHHFRTPAAQSHSHPFSIYSQDKRSAEVPFLQNNHATIVGQLCTPKDILASHQAIKHVAVGDYIIFNQAGAYAWNISHQNFLMHDKPVFAFIENGN
jgi:diaminopimelate decarboxylase